MALARQGQFPADVVGFAPMYGRLGVRGDAAGQWPSPLRPIPKGLRAGLAARPADVLGQDRERQQAGKDGEMAQGLQHAEGLSNLRKARCQSDGKLAPGWRPVLL